MEQEIIKIPVKSSSHANGKDDSLDVKELLKVLSLVKNGKLDVRMPVTQAGINGRICEVLNDIIEMNQRLVTEISSAEMTIGKRGNLSKRIELPDAKGEWAGGVNSLNNLISDLTSPTLEIAGMINSVANGDLSKQIPLEISGHPLKGEFLRIAKESNQMLSKLRLFSMEVTRVARQVGSEGKLGEQAKIKGVAGVWAELTDSVNQMAGNLTAQVRNVAAVTTAVAKGDLSRKITVEAKGEILELKNTINTMVDQLNSFSSEVTRVALEVGTEGKLGGQAKVPGVAGTWKDLTDSVNRMAGNLTSQVRNIAGVTTAVANGDLSKKITVDVKGEMLELKKTINTMVDQLNSFASEVTRVALEVGTEGKLGGQAKVKGVGGVWADLTDSVNQMGSNLTDQVRNIAWVTTAVAKGDLSRKITVDAKGELLELKNTINTMVDQLNSFSFEVTRVAREVGSEGQLGGQANVPGVGGTWKDLTDSVNQMAGNLTGQVRNIAEVTTAVAKGDLSKKITVDVQGEMLELKITINTMVDQLNSFGSEVTRVAREVGSEGQLGGQANVPGVGGTWKDLTDSVNKMADNLTSQVRNIAEVTTAVAKGDLSRKITVNAKGELLELKDTINTMVDQLRGFASEVTRVAREVGSEGQLGGQANVPGVDGTWKDLTDSVNKMAGNLTAQLRNIADVSIAIANGDLSKKITVDVRGEILQLKETINTMVDQLRGFASEVTRVAREVGTDGNLGGQAFVPGVAGTWKDLTDSVNQMSSNLTSQVRNIAEVTKAVASGDLSKTVIIDVKGEIMDLKNTINTMVDQLNSFASEVTRVAREVGTEGKLGGQAHVKGVGGTWKDLTDSVNQMASNLTGQIRGIAKVATGIAKGNLKQRLSINALGEVAQLTDTINEMIDTLAVFADEVTTVAREVGVQGRLGGQASVPGASGTWKDLTENVNQLAQNLTVQVRSISEVASAVTKGDLTRTIRVDAKGELEALKDTINQMIANLKGTTLRNHEQDWLKSNLAKFAQMLQGQRDRNAVANKVLSELAELVNARYGAFYILEQTEAEDEVKLKLFAGYAHKSRKSINQEFSLSEGLIGQCATDKERIRLANVPNEYLQISSGIGNAAPIDLVILPVLFENNVKAVIELASFENFSDTHIDFLDQLTESIGIVLNNIETNTRTEELLSQSQSLAGELSAQQEELRRANDELHDKGRSLEEKAEQLTLTSKYKSEFLANMSHELRTPLNSLLILAQQLFENPEGNLTEKQRMFAKTIHSCGDDLIQLINDILDLSKIESGVIAADVMPVSFKEIASFAESTFKPISEAKNLRFEIDLQEGLPEMMETDMQRLNQILKNLLSNAFKFTEKGSVKLHIFKPTQGQDNPLRSADSVIAFSIEDSGIGISKNTQGIIFEAFQQAEGSTSRKYGGTGLGLSISKGFAELLGGTITVGSELGKGSVFTLFLPLKYKEEKSSANPPKENYPVQHSRSNLIDSAEMVMDDDRHNIANEDKVLLVVEDDLRFTKILIDKAHDLNLKVVVAISYLEIFESILKYNPIAITLDVNMPESNGWKILKLLKTDINLRHIPIHVISGEDNKVIAMKFGAKSFSLKPLSNTTLDELITGIVNFHEYTKRKVLIIEDSEAELQRLTELVSNDKIDVFSATTAKKALSALKKEMFDCIILDFVLPDANGLDLLNKINLLKHPQSTIILHSARDFTQDELILLKRLNHKIITKTPTSHIELLEEILVLLHIDKKHISESKLKMIDGVRIKTDVLDNKKVLVVDDDVRNLFALTAVFERSKIEVVTAESGREALEILNKDKTIDIVLMDIMMPEMDGYETIQIIRKEPRNKALPIIAVTAKAMLGDRQKCIASGASDYITKPVKTDQLLSLMRVWLIK
ncbi:HAMP domain-containing protein [Mucilaginibacter sp. E4BP6]|jgi:HAMP domain-containing protein/signal transduction histidine kinase/CheY-like chemotaxis protein|uniref:HAMP domain-containing protein n=1 Tax=Mucilaginibacter sp. E4BP6 TaxID=2723089 RepID=UPI0015CEED95|nr:HAMP domain-containing protein [Mucilaginibacter sp. E4BP6]NYE66035.1 HAMP domain-containing protein/signal transduction histidine kinase/CheY-like chemotaxis protein [Mucilaginibacter sp. E4BP6]